MGQNFGSEWQSCDYVQGIGLLSESLGDQWATTILHLGPSTGLQGQRSFPRAEQQ